jgi:hypothetical protein
MESERFLENERKRAMKTMKISAVVLAAGMAMGTCGLAQSGAPGAQTAQTQGATPTWTAEQLITSSVHDAWVLSGRNEQTFFQMVSQLAQISAQKRGLTLPDSEAAGKRFGQLIKTTAKADTDQLLYVVVDKAVQQVGTKS